MRWLKQRKTSNQTPSSPQVYPSGICVETESGWFYLKGQKKFKIPSRRTLESWGFPRVVPSSDAAISKYRMGGRLGFREGSLIKSLSDGKLYVVSGNKKCQITNPDTLELLNVTRGDFLTVSNAEANIHEDGEVVDDFV